MVNAAMLMSASAAAFSAILLVDFPVAVRAQGGAGDDFDFSIQVNDSAASETKVVIPRKERRGIVRLSRFFLVVGIIALLVLVIYHVHKRSKTVQGWVDTAKEWGWVAAILRMKCTFSFFPFFFALAPSTSDHLLFPFFPSPTRTLSLSHSQEHAFTLSLSPGAVATACFLLSGCDTIQSCLPWAAPHGPLLTGSLSM